MRFRIVDKEQGEKLIDRCMADKRSNVLQAPKVTVFSGQTALVSATSKSPFVVGVKPVVGAFATAYQPQIRVVSEGTTLRLRAVAERSGEVRLDFAATLSKIQEVGTATFNRTPTSRVFPSKFPRWRLSAWSGGAAFEARTMAVARRIGDIADQMTKVQRLRPFQSWIDWLAGGCKQQEPHPDSIADHDIAGREACH